MDGYEVICHVGSGAFGLCRKVKRKSDGLVFVCKEISYGDMTHVEKQLLVSEVNILQTLHHPHIVTYHNRIIDKWGKKLYIVMEYCHGGDLASYINAAKKQNKYLDDKFVCQILSQLCEALYMCHTHSTGCILHRDIKPANIFLDTHRNVKLGDFGVAKQLPSHAKFAKTFVGTPYYMSPEIFEHRSYNQSSDMWSVGCVLYELCSLERAFIASNLSELAQKVKNSAALKHQQIPPQYSSFVKNTIRKLLFVDHLKRLTVTELKKSIEVNDLVKMTNTTNQKEMALKRKTCDVSVEGDNDSVIKQKKLKAWHDQLSARESELVRREQELQEREVRIGTKEALLRQKMRQHSPRRQMSFNDICPSPPVKESPLGRSPQSAHIFVTPLQRKHIPKMCYT